jgi:hypothetical protein
MEVVSGCAHCVRTPRAHEPRCKLYRINRQSRLYSFAGSISEALSGTRTLDPLLTMKVAKEEREGTDDPSSPSDPGDSGA